MATVTAPTPRTMAGSHWLILHDVAWETYCQLRDAESNNFVRMVYLDGELALMSPELRHDIPIELLGQLIRGVVAGLGLEVMGIRTTTLRREGTPGRRKGAGKEPDTAYYLGGNERRMRMREELDLNVDPPPDLAIEVENTNELSTMAMAVYARLGVPEVWRFHVGDRSVSINYLDGGQYREVDRSVALPKLTPSLILEALNRFTVGDLGEIAWYEWVKAWVRTLPEPDPAI